MRRATRWRKSFRLPVFEGVASPSIFFCLTLLMGTFIIGSPAVACQCVPPNDEAGLLKEAEQKGYSVLEGTILSARPGAPDKDGDDTFDFTMHVTRVLNGPPIKQVAFSSVMAGEACGFGVVVLRALERRKSIKIVPVVDPSTGRRWVGQCFGVPLNTTFIRSLDRKTPE